MSWLSKSLKKLDKWAGKQLGFLRPVSDVGYKAIGQQSPGLKEEAGIAATAAAEAARKAAHDAEVAQLAQDSLGAVSLRRRRGLYATKLTGTPPVTGGKTILGQ